MEILRSKARIRKNLTQKSGKTTIIFRVFLIHRHVPLRYPQLSLWKFALYLTPRAFLENSQGIRDLMPWPLCCR